MNITYTLINLLIWLFLKAAFVAFVVFSVFLTIKLLKKTGMSVFKRRFFGGLVGLTMILFLFIPNLMSKVSEHYFDRLCKEEAGQFVYKTVEDVDGIFMLRPRNEVTDKMLKDRYMQDPLGHDRKSFKSNVSKFVGSNGYDFVEMMIEDEIRLKNTPTNIRRYDFSMFDEPGPGDKYVRYCCAGKELNSLEKIYSPTRKSRYGYTWQDISYPYDRELGIAGSELIVKDLEDDKILGLFRGFVRSNRIGFSDDGLIFVPVNWGGPKCPIEDKRNINFKIISSILKPKQDSEAEEYNGGNYE